LGKPGAGWRICGPRAEAGRAASLLPVPRERERLRASAAVPAGTGGSRLQPLTADQLSSPGKKPVVFWA